MTMVAFILRPWISIIQEIGAIPRILADDILVWDSSDRQEANFRDAYNATFRYIEDIGGKAAPDKSFTFSTSRTTRQRLRCKQWEEAGNNYIKVCTQGRDLGGHFSMGPAFNGSTCTNRMAEATKSCSAIRYTGHSYVTKAKVVRTAIIPKGLYGCESAPTCLLYTSPSPRD